MSRDYQLGYSKGYAAGLRRSWPQFRPPVPDDDLMADIMNAAGKLRDAAASICQKLEEQDEFVNLLWPAIQELDAANLSLSAWCSKSEPTLTT